MSRTLVAVGRMTSGSLEIQSTGPSLVAHCKVCDGPTRVAGFDTWESGMVTGQCETCGDTIAVYEPLTGDAR